MASVSLQYSFLIIIHNIPISKGQPGCYFSILDRSRLDTCVDERGGVITDFSPLKAVHTNFSCDTLRHNVCSDGRWLAEVKQDDEIEMEQLLCDESILPTTKKKRVNKNWWGRRYPPPPPPPPPSDESILPKNKKKPVNKFMWGRRSPPPPLPPPPPPPTAVIASSVSSVVVVAGSIIIGAFCYKRFRKQPRSGLSRSLASINMVRPD